MIHQQTSCCSGETDGEIKAVSREKVALQLRALRPSACPSAREKARECLATALLFHFLKRARRPTGLVRQCACVCVLLCALLAARPAPIVLRADIIS